MRSIKETVRRAGWLAGSTLLLAAMMGTAFTAAAAAAGVPDWTQHGFPQVVAHATVTPAHGATLRHGALTVKVPAGAVASAVDFELLEGPVSSFTAKAPAGQTPVADFAFKVVNKATGQLVGKFSKPAVAILKNARITTAAKYWNITPSGAYAANPVPPKISAGVLAHGIKGAPVGWVVTVPTAATARLPKTGSSPAVPVAGGLLLAGGVALLFRRRATTRPER